MLSRHKYGILASSTILTIAYGYLIVWLFEINHDWLETLSWSFVMLVPYSIGAFGVWRQNTKETPLELLGAIAWPWAYCLGVFAIVMIFSAGMLFCFIIGLPILFPAASAGGVTMWLLQNKPKLAKFALILITCTPFLATPVEAQFATPESITTTHTSIHINASAETVWNLITAVNPVTEAEQRNHWLYWIGAPRPVSATLDKEGIGGIRSATWESGLQFDETITAWEPNRKMAFTIIETSEEVLPAPLDLIEGEYFTLIDGIYRIEELADGTVELHFTSNHYLGTRFNRYGAWWAHYVMHNLQNNLLTIVKTRAETGTN